MTNFRDTHPVPELLAPAGGTESFDAALAAGADAIYCAVGHDFNARRGAHNFTLESFADAAHRAHLAGVRVYVTVNVVIASDEMPTALTLVREAWLAGADAFIIQDWGLLFEVRHLWPQIECHVSTQANVHDARAVAWCRDTWGVARVTLSRELSVAEIGRIAKEGVELESFGHGALCFCYSGVCMMSSLIGGRSANRGMCAQPCRLPYELVDAEGKPYEVPGVTTAHIPETSRGVGGVRALCPKDFYTIDDLPALADAGLGSLKVEGRMKAPDYVYAVTCAYRGALDDLAAGRKPSKEDDAIRHRLLRRAFNRDFTDAYLWGRSGNAMMSYERSNNRGELVGEVIASRDLGSAKVRRGGSNGGRHDRFRTVTRADVDVRLTQPVGEGDLLELRPVKDPSQFLTAHAMADAEAGETITCRTARPLPKGSQVRVIRSQSAFDEAECATHEQYARRQPVRVRVRARLGQPLVIEIALTGAFMGHEGLVVRVEGPLVEAARTRAVTADELREHVCRMGQTPFEPDSCEIELDEGCGMGFSMVHKLRARACAELEAAMLAPYASEAREKDLARVPSARDLARELRFECERSGLAGRGEAGGQKLGAETSCDFAASGTMDAVRGGQSSPREDQAAQAEICALVSTPEVAKAARAAGATRIYVSDGALAEADLAGAAWPDDMELIPWLDEVCREADHAQLDPLVADGRSVGVGNVSELALAAQRGALAEIRPCIPIHNESALVALELAGARGVWFSPELSLEEVCALAQVAVVPTGLVVSGRTRAMTSEHCVLQVAGRCIHDCAHCELRYQRNSIKSREGLMPVRTDLKSRSRIYAARPLDATPQIPELLQAGVTRFMVDATLLDVSETRFAVGRAVSALAAAREGRRPSPRVAGAVSGHLFQRVE